MERMRAETTLRTLMTREILRSHFGITNAAKKAVQDHNNGWWISIMILRERYREQGRPPLTGHRQVNN